MPYYHGAVNAMNSSFRTKLSIIALFRHERYCSQKFEVSTDCRERTSLANGPKTGLEIDSFQNLAGLFVEGSGDRQQAFDAGEVGSALDGADLGDA